MTEDQKALYFLGNKMVARSLKPYNFTAGEAKYIIMGMSDALKNIPAKVEDSFGPKFNDFMTKKQAVIMEKEKAKAKAEKDKAKVFLDKMAKEKGAQKLASGIIYIPMTEGKGANPKAADEVKVHYHGAFTDGKVFDSSVDRGIPAEFPLNQVIPCWTEGVQLMKVGGKAKLVCPSDTAYGDDGRPGVIPGGATLVFEVELLDIVTKAEEVKVEVQPAAAKAKPKAKEAVKAKKKK
ncbi:MAG: FKBP-type peptidyl-prolyl cis-trans isomerase [Elusimicrobia bacterium]|nr:FKBP-type peptidyl-prolyl cis-trans isomerase [Elusimicrobiota bacterium]